MAKKSVKKRKAPAKKVSAKKIVKKVIAKLPLAKKTFTKNEIYRTIAQQTGITKCQVGHVFDVLGEIIHAHLKSGAAGLLKLEGLMKIEKIHKSAKKAYKGINPFTGKEMLFKAKPARDIVKIRALKRLKSMV